MKINFNLFLKIFVPSLIFVVLILYLRGIHFDWNTWNRLACQINLNCNDCEKDLEGSLVRELVNTLSNVIYLIVGLYIYFKFDLFSRYQRFLILIGFIGVALGSVFYHSSTSLAGLVTDFLGINILLTCLCIVSYEIKYKKGMLPLIVGFVYLFSFLFFNLIFPQNDLVKYIGTGLIATALVFSLLGQLKTKELILGIVFYLIGIICWQIDGRKIYCVPESVLQFHSLWHVCVAIAGLFIVKCIYNNQIKENGKLQ